MTVFLLSLSPPASAEEPVPADSGGATAAPGRPPLSFSEAQEQYEQRHIGFDDYVAMRVSPWTTTPPRTFARWSVPYEGKHKKPLEGAAFYEKLGRPDLVAAYRGNLRKKTLLGVAGGAALAGGGLLALNVFGPKDVACDIGSPGFSACVDRNLARSDRRLNRALVGIGLGAVGAGVIGYAVWRTPHPIATHEARELADGYNKRLQQELGISDEPAPAPRPQKRPGVIQASLTPSVGPGGAGLLLSAVF